MKNFTTDEGNKVQAKNKKQVKHFFVPVTHDIYLEVEHIKDNKYIHIIDGVYGFIEKK